MQPFLVEVIAFIAGVAVTIALGRDRHLLLRVAAMAAVVLAGVLAIQAVTGWQWHRAGARVSPASMHHAIGHYSITLAAFLGAILLGAALRHAWPWRRALHIAAVLLLAITWLFASISGYLLPSERPADAPTHLRFALIHMFAVPAMLAVLLLIMAWRHWRLQREAQPALIRHV